MRKKNKNKKEKERGGKTIWNFRRAKARNARGFDFVAEGRRVKTMGGEVYIFRESQTEFHTRGCVATVHLNITGHSIALALFFLPRLACKNRLQFALWRLLQPIKFDSFHPRETGEAIRWKYFFFSELGMVYTSFEDLSYFFFFSLWSFDTNKKEKVIKYKWS